MNDRYLDEAWAVTLSGKRAPILTHTCRSFLERFCGLMLKREVPEACGLYFPNCRSIHTCMMRVPIDVVWVREDEPGLLEVVSFDIALRPWRFFVRRAAPPDASSSAPSPSTRTTGRLRSPARNKGNRRYRPKRRHPSRRPPQRPYG